MREVTDSVFLIAARTLANCVTPARLETGAIYPDQSALRDVSKVIACSVIRGTSKDNLGKDIRDDAIEQTVADAMWYPDYPT